MAASGRVDSARPAGVQKAQSLRSRVSVPVLPRSGRGAWGPVGIIFFFLTVFRDPPHWS